MIQPVPLNSTTAAGLSGKVSVPAYRRDSLRKGIVHIGIGAFHRAHQAWFMDKLFSRGMATDWAICAIGIMEGDKKICDVLARQDGLYSLAMADSDGSFNVQVIGSIIEQLYAPDNPAAAIDKMAAPETKIITLTITEGGYNISSDKTFDWTNGQVLSDAQSQEHPKTVFGYLLAALRNRRDRQAGPVTIQSCDNMESNGDIARSMLMEFLSKAAPDLIPWVEENVSFPNSMVDRITPATTEALKTRIREEYGIADEWPVGCEKFSQWVIEDNFKAGRPQWEAVGAQIVSDVAPYEKMKIRLLNGGHTLVGLAGYLSGYKYIHESVSDPAIGNLLQKYMDEEVTPTLDTVEGINLNEYKKSIIHRFKNRHIKDEVTRIISETSSKFPKFILPTISDQLNKSASVDVGALITALWYQYIRIHLSDPEPIRDVERKNIVNLVFLSEREANPLLFLKNENIFGSLQKNELFCERLLFHVNATKTQLKHNIDANTDHY